MRGLTRILILLGLIVLVPAAVAAGWWYYWPHYMLARAESAVAREDFAQAGDLLDQQIRTEPKNLRAHFLLVQVLRRLQKPTEAHAALLHALKLILSEPEQRRDLALPEVHKEF